MSGSRASTFVATAAILVLAGGGCAVHAGAMNGRSESFAANNPAVSDWDAFWRARSVSPAPPKTFLTGETQPPEILNLTNGLLSDDVVRRWILADVRRGSGDSWAANHMRIDIVNAGVLGPPGLNGTDEWIATERAKRTVEMTCNAGNTVAAAVISVPKATQLKIRDAGLTDFVIVHVRQATGEPCIRKLSDGTTEMVPARRQRGELSWQLDTGEFRNDPVVGPLWYQARGWSCRVRDEPGMVDEICGLVEPTPRTAAMAVQPAP